MDPIYSLLLLIFIAVVKVFLNYERTEMLTIHLLKFQTYFGRIMEDCRSINLSRSAC